MPGGAAPENRAIDIVIDWTEAFTAGAVSEMFSSLLCYVGNNTTLDRGEPRVAIAVPTPLPGLGGLRAAIRPVASRLSGPWERGPRSRAAAEG